MEKKKKKKRDIAEIAFETIQEATKQVERSKDLIESVKTVHDKIEADRAIHEKNPAAVALGRLGGLKGGPARAKKLSSRKRKEIAHKAAKARWGSKE